MTAALTPAHAREFLVEYGTYLTSVGDTHQGWQVVSTEYSWFKHSDVYFTVVAADPHGGLWSYTTRENYTDGVEIEEDSIVAVVAHTVTKKVVTYQQRAVRRAK